jgi:hypothetical protein
MISKTLWNFGGTQGDWKAQINESYLTITFFVGGNVYEWGLREFIDEKNNIVTNQSIRSEMIQAAEEVLRAGSSRRSAPPGGWVCICDCTICSAWPGEMHQDNSTNYSNTQSVFPKGVDKLIDICEDQKLFRNQMRRCPECGTYYRFHNEYEWSTTGNWDDDYLTRLTPAQAINSLTEEEKKELNARLQTLTLCLNRCLKSSNEIIKEYAKQSLDQMKQDQ